MSSTHTSRGPIERPLTKDGLVTGGGLPLTFCLTGEALTVVGRMSAEDATDFSKLKSALLQRYRYTEEWYRVKFRETKPENGETGRPYVDRLLGYFDHWQEMAKTERTYDTLRDRVVSEQFLLQCDEKLAIFLKERGCKDLNSLAETANHYLEAQGLTNLAKGQQESAYTKGGSSAREPSSAQGKSHCFICSKRGHESSDCWSRSTGSKSMTGWKGKKPESFPKNKNWNEASCFLAERGQSPQEKPLCDDRQTPVEMESTGPQYHASGYIPGGIWGNASEKHTPTERKATASLTETSKSFKPFWVATV
ncbi:hypothetical protein HPB50_020565 [Hyalomma asiaticum]|uniref:Uncharacterized protein n=1 Tax=Hyalomma asiaticum TaxID=266040 RepID=A0ACB7SNX4_HYAAI|nr:hypothetical protein HPB50_020565 [Hyalomma asiaticum]